MAAILRVKVTVTVAIMARARVIYRWRVQGRVRVSFKLMSPYLIRSLCSLYLSLNFLHFILPCLQLGLEFVDSGVRC